MVYCFTVRLMILQKYVYFINIPNFFHFFLHKIAKSAFLERCEGILVVFAST